MVILQTENDICLIQIAKLSPNQLFISDVYIFRKVVIRDMSSQLKQWHLIKHVRKIRPISF
jgi:hypothetical protein